MAIPVAPRAVIEALRGRADRVVCLAAPGELIVDQVYYPRPGEVSDEDVRHFLDR